VRVGCSCGVAAPPGARAASRPGMRGASRASGRTQAALATGGPPPSCALLSSSHVRGWGSPPSRRCRGRPGGSEALTGPKALGNRAPCSRPRTLSSPASGLERIASDPFRQMTPSGRRAAARLAETARRRALTSWARGRRPSISSRLCRPRSRSHDHAHNDWMEPRPGRARRDPCSRSRSWRSSPEARTRARAAARPDFRSRRCRRRACRVLLHEITDFNLQIPANAVLFAATAGRPLGSLRARSRGGASSASYCGSRRASPVLAGARGGRVLAGAATCRLGRLAGVRRSAPAGPSIDRRERGAVRGRRRSHRILVGPDRLRLLRRAASSAPPRPARAAVAGSSWTGPREVVCGRDEGAAPRARGGPASRAREVQRGSARLAGGDGRGSRGTASRGPRPRSARSATPRQAPGSCRSWLSGSGGAVRGSAAA
jgi:hypothetical protein